MRETLLKSAYLAACVALAGGGLALWMMRPAPGVAATADVQPEARALLDEVAATYQALPGYVDHGTFRFALNVNGTPQVQTSPLALAFERPGKLAFEADVVRLTSDGESLVTSNSALKKYIKQDAPKQITPDSILDGPLGAMLGGSPAAAPVMVVLELLTGEKGVENLTENAESVRLEDDRDVEGKPHRSVLITQPSGSAIRLLIDAGSKLVDRIELVVPSDQLVEKAPPGTKLSDLEIAWSSGAIETKAPPAETFAFVAPADFTQVTPAEAAAQAGGEGASPLLGKPAPEFALELIEGDQTRKVSQADLKGKVVVLDFWATWCPPCREELPEIQALAERLAKRADAEKVSVVAVSQDRADDGAEAVRKLVESTLNDLKVGGLLKGKVSRVALDPEQAVGDAFGVQGIPTIVLIDAEGLVQAVHVGYKPGIGEELEQDIATLLSGKSLVEPAGDAEPAKK